MLATNDLERASESGKRRAENLTGEVYMSKLFTVGICLLLAACTSTSKLPDEGGKEQWMIDCSNSTTITACYDQANKKCPTGYDVRDQQVQAGLGFAQKSVRVVCK